MGDVTSGIPSDGFERAAAASTQARLTMTAADFEALRAKHDTSHGSPFDRGEADFYYWRPSQPHYRPRNSPQVNEDQMTPEQIQAYKDGYAYGEFFGDRKDYN